MPVGTVAGVAINTAHELGHKKERVERVLSKLALAQSGYGHFYVEHNRGHHNRVATPEDPASSRLGESFWAFLPRTVVGRVQSAWALGAKRLRAQGPPEVDTDRPHPDPGPGGLVHAGADQDDGQADERDVGGRSPRAPAVTGTRGPPGQDRVSTTLRAPVSAARLKTS